MDGTEVTLREDIPQGHKFALTDIPADAQVIKYGCPIGIAKENISCGSWIHTHNIRTGLGDLLTYTYDRSVTELTPTAPRTFRGYRRPNGKVGIRNEIWIIPTVGCVNNVATAIERKAQKYVQGSVEGIFAFPHPYGCSQMGDDQENTRKILSDLINHPNAGGVLVLGLGCENTMIRNVAVSLLLMKVKMRLLMHLTFSKICPLMLEALNVKTLTAANWSLV